MRTFPVTFSYNNELPIGKLVLSSDKVLDDKLLKDMVFAPAYIKMPDGEVLVTEFSLIDGGQYKKPEETK